MILRGRRTLLLISVCLLFVHLPGYAQTRNLTVVVLVNSQNATGYNPNPSSPGDFQRFAERYLEHLQVPYELFDVATATPPSDLNSRQLIVAGHKGLSLPAVWRDAIVAAVNGGAGFVNLDSDPAIGSTSHISTIFGATGSAAGTPATQISVPVSVAPGGSSPHYIAALQKKFDGSGPLVYPFHTDSGGITGSATSTVLLNATGTVIALLGNDPLIVATGYGAGRAVHFGTLDYLHADRFGFEMGLDDLFWRSLVWAARKPFLVRGYPRFWAVQMDDTYPGWGLRVGDMYNPSLTGQANADGTGGPWKVTGYLYTDNLTYGSSERASVIADVGAGKLKVAPHSFIGDINCGNMFWNTCNGGALTDQQWLTNMSAIDAWKQGNGGADTVPSFSRSLVGHYWDLSNNTGYDLWNHFGFRYITSIQKPGFQAIPANNGSERLPVRPFWIYEMPPKKVIDPNYTTENYPLFFADDYTVGSRSGLPAQTFFLFTTQYLDFTKYARPDFTWPGAWPPPILSVADSVALLQQYTWRNWSGLGAVQIFTHDAGSYAGATFSDRQAVITQASSWLNTNGARHIFLDDLSDYVYARTKSTLTRAAFDGSKLTYTFTGSAVTADGNLIPTQALVFQGDTEGRWQTVPGFQNGLQITQDPPPALQIQSVTPSTGPTTGGTAVTITGAGFTPSASVTFAGVAASFTFVDSTMLTLFSPPGIEGLADVTVTTSNASDTKPAAFSYLGVPRLLRISPTAGPSTGQNKLDLHGTSFTPDAQVMIGGAPIANVIFQNATRLSVTVPTGTTGSAVSVQVSNPYGSSFSPTSYSYLDSSHVLLEDSFNGDSSVGWLASPMGLSNGWSRVGGANEYAGLGNTQQYAGNPAWSNYNFEAKILLFDLYNYPGGIRGRVDPSTGAGYAAWVYPGSSQIVLYRVSGWNIDSPGLVALGTAPLTYDTQFHTLRMVFQGSTILVQWDGTAVISAVDNTYSKGLVALDGSLRRIQYEDVLVTADDPSTLFNPGISIAPGGFNLGPVGNTRQLTVTQTLSDGSTRDVTSDPGISYSSNAGNVASVNSTGLVTAITNGSATITATFSTWSANAFVTVPPLALSRVSPTQGSVNGGNRLDLIGSSFSPNTLVTIGGKTSTILTTSSDGTGMTVLVPSGSIGTADVTASNNSGSITLSSGYNYIDPSTISFSDDFNSGSLASWKPSPLGRFNNWNATGDVAEYNGGGATQIYAGSGAWTDYTFEAKVRLFNGQNYPGGIRGRVNPTTGAAYAVWLYPATSPWGNDPGAPRELRLYRTTGWSIDSPGLTLLATSTVANMDPNVFHRLQLTFSGNQITVGYDGTLVMQTSDATLTSGMVALDVSNQQIQFDDVLVTSAANNLPSISAVSLSPAVVTAGSSVTGTVTLAGAAPSGGAVVTLSSSDSSVTLPSTLTVSPGATSATFTITTGGVPSQTSVTISGTYNGTLSAILTVNPVLISSVSLSPVTVIGGASSTGTVTLNAPAFGSGAVITLSSSNTSAAGVPTSVTVAPGTTTATFSVTTNGVATSTAVTISATYNGAQNATLTVNPVNPAALSSVALSPSNPIGGATSTGTVTLTGAAPPSGIVVALTSNNITVATVPANVTVAAGATTATFTISTTPVAANTTASISATYNSVTKSANLTVRAVTPSSLALSPTNPIGGVTSAATVTLSGAAPSGGAVVTLTSSNTAIATVPASLTISAGATTATFTVSTIAVAANTTSTISAALNGTTKSATLTVRAPTPSTLILNPTSVIGGSSSTATVTLTGVAPTGGAVVTLSTNNTGVATVPANVAVQEGTTTATFAVASVPVAANTNVSISAVLNGTTKSATLTVTRPVLTSLSLAPTSVTGGTTSTGTVVLTGPAPAAGTVVSLSDNSTAASEPTSVTIAAGATSATFTVTTTTVATNTTATISGTFNGTTKSAALTITP
jgi:hypothetical protein